MNDAAVDEGLLRVAVERMAAQNLGAIRAAALERFAEAGLPTTRHEDWRYTNLTPVAALSNRWLAQIAPQVATEGLEELRSDSIRGEIDAHWIELDNGILCSDSLGQLERELAGGVTLSRLSEADGREVHIGDPLSSFNAALMPDALLLKVGAGVALDKPIGFLLRDDASTSVCHVRLLIRLGRGANAEFVEAHRSAGGAEHFANLVTEIELDRGAVARYVKIQERAETHMQVGRLLVRLDDESRFEHSSVDLGGKLIRNDVSVTIAGKGAHFSTSGVYLAHGRQHIDNHICADHAVGPATSRQAYRGIASGRARCVFNGKAIVRQGADGTDAEQTNHNLLLSDRAEIDTKPELEIYADDVKCSHGATVGQLDAQALFYLRSRGLDRERAAQILTRAFAGRVLSEIAVESVRPYVERIVDAKLDALVEADEE